MKERLNITKYPICDNCEHQTGPNTCYMTLGKTSCHNANHDCFYFKPTEEVIEQFKQATILSELFNISIEEFENKSVIEFAVQLKMENIAMQEWLKRLSLEVQSLRKIVYDSNANNTSIESSTEEDDESWKEKHVKFIKSLMDIKFDE